MEPFIVANKYKVVDTLFQSELQNIYVAEEADNFNADQYIINEIIDGSIIYAVKEVFNEDAKTLMKNFVDYFYQDSNFYIVSSISSSNTLDNYLSSNSLRISDKMYITESLLNQLTKLESASRLLKYHLLNLENIAVAGSRTVSFNLDIKFDKEGLYATAATIVSKLGDAICCIFANTPHASLEKDKDNLPPAIAAIVRRCKDESYSSVDNVYRDFKSSLIYSTFIDNKSVDKQITKNLQKATRKRTIRPIKRLAAVLVIVALLAGAYYGFNKLDWKIPVIGGGTPIAKPQNQVPVAKFNISKSKIYVGDKIDFTSLATDPDLDDKITSYEWSVSRNEDMYILFSRDQNPSYVFDAEGDYVVSLIVKDTPGISSEAFKMGFKVYPKEEIPDTPDNSGDEENPILK
jgi:PKD repeat protein